MAQPTRTFNLSDQYPPYGYPVPTSIAPIKPVDSTYQSPPLVSNVDHPPHYVSHPSGVECIQITEHMGFNLGNAFKYIWRAELKGNTVEDLKKARWYLDREITKREKLTTQPQSIPTTPDTSLRSIVNFDAKPTDDYWISTDRDRQARLKT